MSFLRFRVSQLLDYSKLSLRTPETQPDSMSPPRFARTLMRPRERRRLAGPSSCRRALSQTARLPSAPRNTGREPGVGGGTCVCSSAPGTGTHKQSAPNSKHRAPHRPRSELSICSGAGPSGGSRPQDGLRDYHRRAAVRGGRRARPSARVGDTAARGEVGGVLPGPGLPAASRAPRANGQPRKEGQQPFLLLRSADPWSVKPAW